MYRDLLDAEGIEAEVLHGPLPGQLAEVLVDQKDATDARNVLMLLARQADKILACGNCGEESPGTFDHCWSCGQEFS